MSTNAQSSYGADAARTVADVWDTVRYPLKILMMVTLCNLLRSRMLRRLAIRSSAHTGISYITRDRTTLSYIRRTATPADVRQQAAQAVDSRRHLRNRGVEVRRERPLTVDDETQVFHPRSQPNGFACHAYVQSERRKPSHTLVVEPDALRLRRGNTRAQT